MRWRSPLPADRLAGAGAGGGAVTIASTSTPCGDGRGLSATTTSHPAASAASAAAPPSAYVSRVAAVGRRGSQADDRSRGATPSRRPSFAGSISATACTVIEASSSAVIWASPGPVSETDVTRAIVRGSVSMRSIRRYTRDQSSERDRQRELDKTHSRARFTIVFARARGSPRGASRVSAGRALARGG